MNIGVFALFRFTIDCKLLINHMRCDVLACFMFKKKSCGGFCSPLGLFQRIGSEGRPGGCTCSIICGMPGLLAS